MSDETWVAAPLAVVPRMPEYPNRPRWGIRILVGFLALLLVAGATAGGVLFGIQRERDHWQPLYDKATSQVTRFRAESARWQQKTSRTQDMLDELEERVSSSVGDLESPHFSLWNTCSAQGPGAGCPLTPGKEYVGGVPDTFTYQLKFTSTVPVTVWILSSQNFVCWEVGECAPNGLMWENRTELDVEFHQAEGCAGYIAVFRSEQSGTMYPDVQITRNPAPAPTGVCA
jgi:hypothetical protein